MGINVVTSGRTDIEDYFRLSGIREFKKLTHAPFLVFLITGDTVEVGIVDSAKKLLELPDNTKVMAQWRGEWTGDYFQFKVGDLRRHIANAV